MTLWFLLPLTTAITLGWVSYRLPSCSAATVPLGVRVPSTHVGDQVIRDAIDTYRRRVRIITVLAVVVVVVVSAVLDSAGGRARSVGIGLLALGVAVLMPAVVTLAITRCAAPIRRAKDEQGWYGGVRVGLVASLDPAERSARVRWPGFAIAALILAGTAAYGAATYNSMPARIVTHSGPNGPDSWADKGFWPVFGPLLAGVGLTVMMLAIAVPLARRPLPPLPEGDIERARAIARAKAESVQKVTAVSAVFAAATFAIGSVGAWIEASWTVPAVLVVAVTSGPVLLVIVLSDPIVQERTPRVPAPGDPESPDDDRYWKWGCLYNNPDDPRIMVDSRMGFGNDINYGHPIGRLITIVIVAVLVGPPIVIVLAEFAG